MVLNVMCYFFLRHGVYAQCNQMKQKAYFKPSNQETEQAYFTESAGDNHTINQ